MTNEQIEQNAEAYADNHCVYEKGNPNFLELEFAYTAGAHSRDEEIERIKNEATAIMDEACALTTELNKLRNSWISVEERLPEKTRNLSPFPDEYDEKVVLVINKQGGKRLAYRDYKGSWRDDYTCEIVNQNYVRITHWMPIHALNPAEQLIGGLQEMNQQFKKGE